MLRHPPVMVPQVITAALQGHRWQLAKAKGESIAIDAVQRGLIPADDSLRAALGLPKVTEPPKMEQKRTSTQAINTKSSRVRRNDELVPVPEGVDAMSAYHSPHDAILLSVQGQKPRVVTYDVLDMTLGGGHHTAALLDEGGPYTRVVGLDCDVAVQKTTAKAMRETFGIDRFQFFNHRMSDALTLFGEAAFDCILMDPGPNLDQLEDTSRGFAVGTDDDTPFDMRYGPHFDTSAMQWLDRVTEQELVQCLGFYSGVPQVQSRRFARALERERPLRGSAALRNAIYSVSREFASDPWATRAHELHGVRKAKRPLSAQILYAIRSAVNHEHFELLQGMRGAIECLRTEGRCLVVTREPWEHQLLQWFCDEHPYALLVGEATIDAAEADETEQSAQTKLWQMTRTHGPAFATKLALKGPLTSGEKQAEYERWLMGLDEHGQTRGFPAHRFGWGYRASDEERAHQAMHNKKAAMPPDLDRAKPVSLKRFNR